MTTQNLFVLGILFGLAVIPLAAVLVRLFRVEVEDGHSILVTRFGKLAATLTRPGWHWMPDRYLPWVKLIPVSLRRDFLNITDICVNDARGTTVVVDVWIEFRVTDPAKATFNVDDWRGSLSNVVSHAVLSILGNREFKHILCDRTQLGGLLRQDISAEIERWGIEVELVFIQDVSLLPEISQQIFHTIAAHLERAKADIEESGRQRVALLRAETSAQTATLIGEARGQYPAAIGRAFTKLKEIPEVFAAYNELHELSLMRPDQIVAFKGFPEDSLRPVDAAMLAPGSSAPQVGPEGQPPRAKAG